MIERILVGGRPRVNFISGSPNQPFQLEGRFVANDLEPLYGLSHGELALPAHASALPEDSLYVQVPQQREVMVSSLSDPFHVAPCVPFNRFFSLPCGELNPRPFLDISHHV